MKISSILPLLMALILFCSCQGNKKKNTSVSSINIPIFQEDSAFQYLQHQVDFGPRVPNTEAHEACGDYLQQQLIKNGATVQEQRAVVKAFDGTELAIRNIIASYQPEKTRRVLLFSHWDSRPWADQDERTENHRTAISGANDGGSGTAVLLEIARILSTHELPNIGVDIILFDAEDYGEPSWALNEEEDSWCLGSQYWARNPHQSGYRAEYGILLDMVGHKDACFLWEYFSQQYADNILRKVWGKAIELGYGNHFMNSRGGAVTDDHLYLNRLSGIPCIDIIDYNDSAQGFFVHWHTVDDVIDHIDKETLKAVGQTLLAVLFSE